MMFAAGALIWLNVSLARDNEYGWPIVARDYSYTYYDGVVGGYHITPTPCNHTLVIAIDVLICAGILACVAVECERRLRDSPKFPKLRTLALEILTGVIGALWNSANPVWCYYFYNSMPALAMRLGSLVVILFLVHFFSENFRWPSR